jgi:3-oxoacyl-[acyl-carrier protein] reductase
MTGAASVIGRALLRRLWADPAWAGVRFLLTGRDPAALSALVASPEARHHDAEALTVDLCAPVAVQALRKRLGAAGPLLGLALVAGVNQDDALPKLDEADWDRVWQVNLAAHRRLLSDLNEPGRLAAGARGLLVGSIVGLRGNAGQSAYAAAKGALLDLLPMAPQGLRLNVLLPPLVPSPLLKNLSPAARERLFKTRLMDDPDPAESAAAAGAFLLSDRSSYIHRQAVHADSRVTALGSIQGAV